MVNKLTFETINSKIGKPGDPAALEEVALPNKQIDEVGSFAKFAKLKKLDLSNNRMRFKRNIEGLFQAPALEELDLRGNPVCNEAGYRQYMIEGIKTLKVLDGVPIGSERDQKAVVQNTPKKSSLFDDDVDDSDNLFSNKTWDKNDKPQPTKDAPVKVQVAEEEKKIPAKTTTSPLHEPKPEPVATEQPPKEISPPLPKEEKPVSVEKTPEPEKLKEVPKPKIEEQPVKKFEEKSTKTAPVPEKKPAQIEKPKEDPKPKPTPKTDDRPNEDKTSTTKTNTTTQSTPGVFKDSRSGLEISTKLHEGVQAPEPQVVEVEPPKKEMLTEDSLFGSKKSVFQDNVTIDRSLLEITEVPQKKPVVQKEQPKPAAKVTVTIADDDDDLFGTKSSAHNNNKKASVGDDLFDMVGSTNKKDTVDLSKLNIDEYLANQSSANDSLFD